MNEQTCNVPSLYATTPCTTKKARNASLLKGKLTCNKVGLFPIGHLFSCRWTMKYFVGKTYPGRAELALSVAWTLLCIPEGPGRCLPDNGSGTGRLTCGAWSAFFNTRQMMSTARHWLQKLASFVVKFFPSGVLLLLVEVFFGPIGQQRLVFVPPKHHLVLPHQIGQNLQNSNTFGATFGPYGPLTRSSGTFGSDLLHLVLGLTA